jgi:TIR domain
MSSTTSTPTVFLSYSHRDQVVARRIVRELTERRVKTWLDERELRIGAALTASIRSQIEAADACSS